MRRRCVGLAGLASASALALWGCDAEVVKPVGEGVTITVVLAFPASEDGAVTIPGEIDALDVVLQPPDGSERDTLVAMKRIGTELRGSLNLRAGERVDYLHLRARLLAGSRELYTGEALLSGRGRGEVSIPITMEPVAERLTVEPAAMSFDALTDTGRAVVRGYFAGGGEIPALPVTWTSRDTQVATVGPDGVVHSAGNGATVVEASLGAASVTIAIEVRQVAQELTGIEPSHATVTAGRTLELQAVGRDRLGRPLVRGFQTGWTVGPPDDRRVLVVDSGGSALALGAGNVTVHLDGGGAGATASVEVVAPGDRGEWPLVYAKEGLGLVLGDLAGGYEVLVADEGAREPTREPNGPHVAFARGDSLYVCDLDCAPTAITVAPEVGLEVDWPEFSADGAWIFFHLTHGTHQGGYQVHPDGSDLRLLPVAPTDFSVSPDGWLYASIEGGGLVVHRGVVGAGYWRLLDDASAANPSWSPDGEWIGFTSDRDTRIGLIRPDGTDLRLVPGPGFLDGYTWSPDGKWIVGVDEAHRAAVVSVATGESFDLPWSALELAWWR